MRDGDAGDEYDEEMDEGDEYDEDEEADDAYAPTSAPRGGLTLDMIATSTSHSANKVQPAASKPRATPKGTARPTASEMRKRKREEEEGDDDEDEFGAAASAAAAASSTSFAPSSVIAVPSSASGGVPAFAPAATAVGGLFSQIQPSLDPEILRVLHESFGFTRMTPVQQQTIPTFLRKDVAVQSYTGQERQGSSHGLLFVSLSSLVPVDLQAHE